MVKFQLFLSQTTRFWWNSEQPQLNSWWFSMLFPTFSRFLRMGSIEIPQILRWSSGLHAASPARRTSALGATCRTCRGSRRRDDPCRGEDVRAVGLLKMAIEIVDFPIKNGDFAWHNYGKSPFLMGKSAINAHLNGYVFAKWWFT